MSGDVDIRIRTSAVKELHDLGADVTTIAHFAHAFIHISRDAPIAGVPIDRNGGLHSYTIAEGPYTLYYTLGEAPVATVEMIRRGAAP